MKTIAIIGFGKIGQALAANALQQGHSVHAADRDPSVVEQFRHHTFTTNEPGVETILTAAFNAGKLTVDTQLVTAGPDAVIISIPLTVDEHKKTINQPFVECIAGLIPFCRERLLIIVETSVPVGFCRLVLLPVLTSAGKQHGVDFLLAHSPERIKSGSMLKQLATVPKAIGGITLEAAEACLHLYASLLNPELLHVLDSIESAEMLKLAGMIYRDVNIALSNQLAMFAQGAGIDFTSLIPLINTDQEAHLLQPGIGVGGHCTPVYPHFLIDNFSKIGLDFTLAKAGRAVNEFMPAFALSLVKDRPQHKTALILGLSFRPDVKEDANSTGAELYSLLSREGFEVAMHDAVFSAAELEEKGFTPGDPSNTRAAIVFLVTMHREYQQLDFKAMAANGVQYIVDGRNALDRKTISEAGIYYTGIGH